MWTAMRRGNSRPPASGPNALSESKAAGSTPRGVVPAEEVRPGGVTREYRERAEDALMQGNMLPILIAGAVMMFVYGIAQIVAALTDAEKRKLKQRLTGDSNVRPGIDSGSPQLSLTRIHDAGSVTTLLTKFSFFERLNTMLIYAYPEMSLAQFVSIALGIGVLAGMLTF